MTGVLSRCSKHGNTGRRGSDYFGTYPQLFRHLVSRFLPSLFLSFPFHLLHIFLLFPAFFSPPSSFSSPQQLLLMLCSLCRQLKRVVSPGKEQEGEIFLCLRCVLLYTGNKALHHLARHFERSSRFVSSASFYALTLRKYFFPLFFLL